MKLQIMNRESEAILTFFHEQVVTIKALVYIVDTKTMNTTRNYTQSS